MLTDVPKSKQLIDDKHGTEIGGLPIHSERRSRDFIA